MCNMTKCVSMSPTENEPLTRSQHESSSKLIATTENTDDKDRFAAIRLNARMTFVAGLVLVAVMGSINATESNSSSSYTILCCVLCLALVVGYQQRHCLSVAWTRGIQKVSSSDNFRAASSTIKRISSNQCWDTLHGKKQDHVMALSCSEPFVPLDVIAQLTLSDVTRVFEYAMNPKSNSQTTTTTTTSPFLSRVFAAMDVSVGLSRGVHVVEESTCGNDDDMDALRFCAAVRIFGEWRVLRQVPDGYKGYAVGMNLGKRDIVQNLVKMEHAVHMWIDTKKRETQSEKAVTSPTLRELLQHEVDTKVHRRLPVLKDKTAAIGLVWIYRQLQYQTCMYSNIVEQPDKPSKEAVSAAYNQVYDRYHGWAVQKIFKYSFQGAPPAQEIYNYMNPTLLQQVTARVEQPREKRPVLMKSETLSTSSSSSDDESYCLDQDCTSMMDDEWEVVPSITESSFLSDCSSSDEEDEVPWMGVEKEKVNKKKKKNAFEQFGMHIVQESEKFGKNMERGWSEFVASVANLFDKDKRNQHKNKSSRRRPSQQTGEKVAGNSSSASATDEELENSISMEMTKNAHRQMKVYLQVAKPMMRDLLQMVEQLNMNDPTKV